MAERLLAQDARQHLQHDGRFIVNDVPIHQAGVPQIVQILLDGIRPGRTVLGIRGGDIVAHEIQPVIHARIKRLHDAGGEVIGEDLLGPHVVEPFHRHVIAEPHVRGLVGDQGAPPQALVQRGTLVEKHPAVVVQRGARVLHAAELEPPFFCNLPPLAQMGMRGG